MAKSMIRSEQDGDDPLDLLDREALLGRISTAAAKNTQGPKGPERKAGGIRRADEAAAGFPATNKEGKLVIVDLERQERKAEKAKRRRHCDSEDSGDDGEDGDEEWMGGLRDKVKRKRHADVMDVVDDG